MITINVPVLMYQEPGPRVACLHRYALLKMRKPIPKAQMLVKYIFINKNNTNMITNWAKSQYCATASSR